VESNTSRLLEKERENRLKLSDCLNLQQCLYLEDYKEEFFKNFNIGQATKNIYSHWGDNLFLEGLATQVPQMDYDTIWTIVIFSLDKQDTVERKLIIYLNEYPTKEKIWEVLNSEKRFKRFVLNEVFRPFSEKPEKRG
jgi:hypothetical protein